MKFQHYWKSAAQVPNVPGRGFQMKQSLTSTVNNISIDEDHTQQDLKGETFYWAILDK